MCSSVKSPVAETIWIENHCLPERGLNKTVNPVHSVFTSPRHTLEYTHITSTQVSAPILKLTSCSDLIKSVLEENVPKRSKVSSIILWRSQQVWHLSHSLLFFKCPINGKSNRLAWDHYAVRQPILHSQIMPKWWNNLNPFQPQKWKTFWSRIL